MNHAPHTAKSITATTADQSPARVLLKHAGTHHPQGTKLLYTYRDPSAVSVLYAVAGDLKVSLNSKRPVSCPQNHFCIIAPGSQVEVDAHIPEESPRKFIILSVQHPEKHFGESAAHLRRLFWLGERIGVTMAEEIVGLQLLREVEDKHQLNKNVVEATDSFAWHLLAYLRAEFNMARRIPSSKLITQLESYLKIRNARTFMLHHITSEVSLQFIADYCGMSRFHFSRCFSAVYHQSPHHFHQELRLLESKRLVEEGEMKLMEISMLLNFTDFCHFSKQFKQRFGVPPSAWIKEQHREFINQSLVA